MQVYTGFMIEDIGSFEFRKKTHQYWYNKSNDLRASAGALWFAMRDSDNNIAEHLKLGSGFSMGIACYPVFPMLCGLSLEVLYKAICVRKDIKFKSTHNLIILAKDAQIDITDEESKFLKFFTESIIWNGKYPVPSDKQKHEYDKLTELHYDFLFDKIKIGSLDGYTPNGKLNWENFNNIWLKGSYNYHF